MTHLLPWLFAVLSGLCLALAMPGPGLGPLALLFPAFLLEALERERGQWTPWLLGWLAGTVFWVISTNWVIPVMHNYGGLPQWAAVGCLIGMGAYLGLLWALAAGLTSLVPTVWRIWVFPAAWIALGVLQRYPPYGFTWTGAASAFVDWPWLMASLPVWGATGLGWWVVAISSGVWGLFQFDTRRTAGAVVAFSAVALVLAIVVSPAPAPSSDPIRVAAIQPGTTLEEKWDPSQSREIADRIWAMTADAGVRGADLVLWPESAVPYRLDSDPAYREAVENMAAQFEIEIVLNSVAGVAGGGYANSAFLVTTEGVSPVRYDKVHLVPFGEFVPRWAQLAFTRSLVREVGAFTPGSKPLVLPAMVPVGVAICFEVVFPDLPVAQVRGGAQLLATVTNDGWYGFSWAPRQHFAQVRLRAAETGRWFARAALTGISGFVDPTGRVVSRLDVGETGVLAESVQPMTGLTPRVRWGDWWAVLCALATVAMAVAARLADRSRFNKKRPVKSGTEAETEKGASGKVAEQQIVG
jgi:apolipoprotein N-acyltransferase